MKIKNKKIIKSGTFSVAGMLTDYFFFTWPTGSPCLQFVLRDLYLYKDFVWELLDQVIYKTLYGDPLDFSKIYDIFMNDEIKLIYLLFIVYLSVLCSLRPFGAILSDLSTVRCPQLEILQGKHLDFSKPQAPFRNLSHVARPPKISTQNCHFRGA